MQRKIRVKIRGTCDLLQHKRSEKSGNKEKKLKKTQAEVDYSESWREALYRDDEIGCYLPSDYISACLVKSGTGYQFKGQKTFKDIVKAVVLVEPEKIPLGKDKPDYIDKRYGVIQRNQVLVYRPAFRKGWEAEFDLTILDDEQISTKTLKEILDNAGTLIAIGDWRPRFGRFEVIEFSENKRKPRKS